MKKAIVLGAAMLLAGAAAFAADEKKASVLFSGAFKAGYNFDFVQFNKDTKKGKKQQFGYYTDDDDKNEGEFDLNVADADGIWKLTFRQDDGNLFGDFNFRTKAVIDVGKSLKSAGVDMGDVSAKLTFGRYSGETLNNAFLDLEGNHWQRVKTNGSYSVGLEAGYGKLVGLQFIVDPTKNASTSKSGDATYGFAVTSTPIDGVKVAVDFSRHGKSTQYGTKTETTDPYSLDTKTGKIKGTETKTFSAVEDYAIGLSTTVDINKFANIDKLTLVGSGYYTFRRFGEFGKAGAVEKDVNKQNFGAALKVGYDKVNGWIEYNYAEDNNDADGNGVGEQWMKALVNLGGLVGVKGLGLDAYYMQRSFDDTWFSVGADVSYKLAGVTYGLKAEFTDKDLSKTDSTTTFRVRPSVLIEF